MPNHIHGIVWITRANAVGARHTHGPDVVPTRNPLAYPERPTDLVGASPLRTAAASRGSLGAIVGSFKSAATKRINELRNTPGAPVWQRNYYEHIIRDEEDLYRIRQYIRDNPRRWHEDENNPANFRPY